MTLRDTDGVTESCLVVHDTPCSVRVILGYILLGVIPMDMVCRGDIQGHILLEVTFRRKGQISGKSHSDGVLSVRE